MKVRLVTMAALAISFVIPMGFATPAQAYTNRSDFSFFDNTSNATEGVQCTTLEPFAYAINVSEFTGNPNVVKISLADGDFTRYKIAANGTLNLQGYARGGNQNSNANPPQDFPDRCITVCAETPGALAGQVSIQTVTAVTQKIKCNNVTCGAGGTAPVCPLAGTDGFK